MCVKWRTGVYREDPEQITLITATKTNLDRARVNDRRHSRHRVTRRDTGGWHGAGGWGGRLSRRGEEGKGIGGGVGQYRACVMPSGPHKAALPRGRWCPLAPASTYAPLPFSYPRLAITTSPSLHAKPLRPLTTIWSQIS